MLYVMDDDQQHQPPAPDPAPSPTEREKFEQRLYPELGRFVHIFAAVESGLSTTARVVTGAPSEILLAVVDSWRADSGIRVIRRALAVTAYSEELKKDFDTALARLAEISNLRNAILHGMTVSVPDQELAELVGLPPDHDFGAEFVATNILQARSDEAFSVYPVSADILRAAVADLDMVTRYLRMCEAEILDARYPQRPKTGSGVAAQRAALRQKAWQWTPPPKHVYAPLSEAAKKRQRRELSEHPRPDRE
jgi:hypothetical protein